MPSIGEPFERLVAQIQTRLDPNSSVSHNEFLIDRLGQRRQFDVTIRGHFAGQNMLGVIECKDLNRKVGTPEIDAFHTKAQDINANFRVIASRRGFTGPALQKAKHYGIRLITLLDPEVLNKDYVFGDWWVAKVYRWKALSIQAKPVGDNLPIIETPPASLLVKGGRVLDWFTNHLVRAGHQDKTLGWAVALQMTFDPPIELTVGSATSIKCQSITFGAERELREYERFVPLTAEAFVDWHANTATIPANTQVLTQAIPTDFHDWSPRDSAKTRESCLLPIAIVAHEHQFDHVPSAPDLESM
jgi:hypothetical protein